VVVDERWAYGSSLHVEAPTVGNFFTKGLYTGIELKVNQSNWLVGSVPALNIHEGWRIKAVMIRYNIRGAIGVIDKIGVRQGNLDVHGFEGLNIGPNSTWETRKLELPNPSAFTWGLGVTIHCAVPQQVDVVHPTQFLFTSIGLEFIK
jgi:hypothetical protein